MQREIGQLNKSLTIEKMEEIARKYESDCDAGIDEKEARAYRTGDDMLMWAVEGDSPTPVIASSEKETYHQGEG